MRRQTHNWSQSIEADRRVVIAAQRLDRKGFFGNWGRKRAMNSHLPVEESTATMFTLLDPKTMRVQLPALSVDGLPDPLRIQLDLNAQMVDEILLRLTVLRLAMLPAPQRN